MFYLKKLFITISLLSFFQCSLLAHKNFWEIKATALPEEDSVSFTLMFSLDQLKEFFKDKLTIKDYRPEDKNKITEALVTLAPEIITLQESGQTITPFVKNVNLFIDEELAQEKSLSLSAVDIDIELVFLTNKTELHGQWNIYADSLLEKKSINLDTLPKGALDVNIYFLDENSSKFTVNSSNRNFTWSRKSTTEIKGLNGIPIHKSIKSRNNFIPLTLITLVAILWSFSTSKTFSIISALIISISALSFATPILRTSETVVVKTLPDEKAITEFMKSALQKMYVSSTSINNDLKWNALTGVSTDSFRENMFISNFNSKESKISHFVESVKITSIRQISDNQIECSWSANALFQHISHIHEKSMSFKAKFLFELIDNKWLINDVNVRRLL